MSNVSFVAGKVGTLAFLGGRFMLMRLSNWTNSFNEQTSVVTGTRTEEYLRFNDKYLLGAEELLKNDLPRLQRSFGEGGR